MKKEKIKINNIPSIVWGEKSLKVFIAIHGNMSNKEDEVIKILAKEVVSKGYQLLSFDLLSILKDGEHYLHTEKQLDYYRNWLSKTIM